MATAAALQLRRRGLLISIASHCGSGGGPPPAGLGGLLLGRRRWGVWAAWRASETLACYALSAGDAVLGLAVLLATPWVVYRSGLLRCGPVRACLLRWS